MKYLQRFCCLLLCFLLLFPVFSLNASAKSLDIPNYNVVTYVYKGDSELGWVVFNPRDNTADNLVTQTPYSYNYTSGSKFTIDTEFSFLPQDTNYLFKKGSETEVKINNCFFWHKAILNGGQYPSSVPDSVSVVIYYTDHTIKTIDDVTFSKGGNPLDISFKFTPTRDVSSFTVFIKDTIQINSSGTLDYYYKIGEVDNSASNGYYLEIVQPTEEEGLLSGIIEWLKGIKNGITDLFDSIAELPSKLWSAIENGLKALFVPSSDFVRDMSNNFDTLLIDRFGAVYQIGDELVTFFENLVTYSYFTDTQSVIDIPETTIDLGNNESFTFGGYSVSVVPENFEFLADTIKGITAILAVFAFANGLIKKYEEIMGVEK